MEAGEGSIDRRHHRSMANEWGCCAVLVTTDNRQLVTVDSPVEKQRSLLNLSMIDPLMSLSPRYRRYVANITICGMLGRLGVVILPVDVGGTGTVQVRNGRDLRPVQMLIS